VIEKIISARDRIEHSSDAIRRFLEVGQSCPRSRPVPSTAGRGPVRTRGSRGSFPP
jgi:hypothetical protein